jgi:hypothetical protein
MLPATLPPVDPEFLISVRDPELLDAYARGLLGACPGDYPLKAAACWLFDAYAAAILPLSPNAALLARQLLSPEPQATTSPVRGKSRDAYWSAIEFEAGLDPEREPDAFDAHGRVKAYRVAQHLVGVEHCPTQKAAEKKLSGWRKSWHYQANVEWQRDPAAWARAHTPKT